VVNPLPEASDPVEVRCESGVGWLVLNRPERRNAISLAMREQLREQLERLNDDDAVRVVVLTGAGSAFCAGVDLTERNPRPATAEALQSKPVAAPLRQFDKPILAAINGPAVGGGLELALAADLRIASSNATFALPEVKLGSLAGSGGTQQLIRAMPPAVARKAIFTGEPFDAETALRYGLVSDVLEPQGLLAGAEQIAGQIAANAPLSLRAAKIALATAESLSGGQMLERALWGLLSLTADREEGRAAFRDRRPPHFSGR
jgi:E-phenylitaconyl-CoA hydratase